MNSTLINAGIVGFLLLFLAIVLYLFPDLIDRIRDIINDLGKGDLEVNTKNVTLLILLVTFAGIIGSYSFINSTKTLYSLISDINMGNQLPLAHLLHISLASTLLAIVIVSHHFEVIHKPRTRMEEEMIEEIEDRIER